jgi:hypothetical protein
VYQLHGFVKTCLVVRSFQFGQSDCPYKSMHNERAVVFVLGDEGVFQEASCRFEVSTYMLTKSKVKR